MKVLHGLTAVSSAVQIRVPDRAKKYRERNFRMREWVQLQEGRAGFIDYESLSLTPGAPPTTVHDKHYMCYVTWPQVCAVCASAEAHQPAGQKNHHD